MKAQVFSLCFTDSLRLFGTVVRLVYQNPDVAIPVAVATQKNG